MLYRRKNEILPYIISRGVMNIFRILCLLFLPIYSFSQYSAKQIDTLLMNEKKFLEKNYSNMDRVLWNKKLIDVSHQTKYAKGEVLGYINVATIFYQNFQLKESLRYLHIAKTIANNVNDDFVKGRLNMAFAQVYNQLGLFETAIKYCDLGIFYYSRLKPAAHYKTFLRYAYGCKGAYYQEVDPKKSLISLRKAVELDPTPIALSNIADYYLKFEHNQDSAELYLKKSFELLETPAYQGKIYHKAGVLTANGNFLISVKLYREAIVNFKEVLELSKRFVDPNVVLMTRRSMTKAYRLLGDRKHELEFREKARMLEDSLAGIKNQSLAMSVDKLFDETATYKQSLQKKQRAIEVIIILSLFFIILIVFLLLRYRNKTRSRIWAKQIENEKLINLVSNNTEEVFNEKVDHLIELAEQNDPKFFVFFQEVYPSFIDKLRAIDPKINNETLKFCALLKLNLSTKDISLYTHIEIRSVQTRKSRLRKQLNIPSDVDLNTFMDELG